MASLNVARENSPHPEQRTIFRLQDTIRRMQDEIDYLKQALASVSRTGSPWETDWGLSVPEATILGVLVRHRVATKSALMVALYSARGPDAEPNPDIINVFIFRLRKKLRPQGVVILTMRGRGWQLREQDRRRLSGDKGAAR